MEVVASLSQGRTAAAQCGLFTHKSVPIIFEPPCTIHLVTSLKNYKFVNVVLGGSLHTIKKYTEASVVVSKESGLK